MISVAITEDSLKLSLIKNIADESKVEKLPDAILKDLDNKKVSISDIVESRPTLISFWFLACEPCKKEMKYLDEFNIKYAGSGFQVIIIKLTRYRINFFVRIFPITGTKFFRIPESFFSSYECIYDV